MNKYKYNLIIAKPNFCVPATLQMVLEYHGITGINQELIASQLTITPDNDDIEHIHWGTYIEHNTLNSFFKRNEICLNEKYIPINIFMDSDFFIEKVKELLDNNISIICGYNYTWLFGDCDDTYRHVSIIVDIILNENKVLLLDPGPKEAGYKYVSADKLFYAIKAGKDGLWCIVSRL